MAFCDKMYFPPSDAKAAAVDDLHSTNNIVLIPYSTLKEYKKQHKGVPFSCRGCGSALCYFSKLLSKTEYDRKMIQEEFPGAVNDAMFAQAKDREKKSNFAKGKFLKDLSKDERGWICEFCDVHNRVPKDVTIPQTEDQLYLIKKGQNYVEETKIQVDTKGNLKDETTVVFCIDISGSMKELHQVNNDGKITDSSRIKLISDAIYKQIENMKNLYPNRKVGVVLFNSTVHIKGDFSQAGVVIQSDFHNFHKLLNYSILKAPALMYFSLQESFPLLKQKILELDEFAAGTTALGPGLICSLGLASQGKPGSRIILCTDGLANVGLGSFKKNESDNDALAFYDRIADIAVAKGISVSVITVKGNVCRVDALGPLAEKTGGTITRVDPANLDLSDVASNNLIATNVMLKVIIHEALTFQNEDAQNLHNNKSILTKNVGSVSESNEVYFEYKVKSNAELKKEKMSLANLDWIPLQSQITYTDLQGNQFIRVICKKQMLTQDQDEVHKDAKAHVLANFVQVQNANLVLGGRVNEAKMKNKQWAQVMDKMSERKDVGLKNQAVIQKFQKEQKNMKQLIKDSEAAQKNQKSSVEKDEIHSQWYHLKQKPGFWD